MNLTSADPTAPPQPPRSSFSCDRHPDEQFTGFCPSCLCERLTTLDSSANAPSSSSRRPSNAAASAIKSLFFSSNSRAASNSALPPPPPSKPSRPASYLPDLRRTKSFSASKNEALVLSLEPHRKSCDVRAQNTLCTPFSIDGDGKPISAPSSSHQTQYLNSSSSKPLGSSVLNNPVLEEVENEEDFKDPPENLDDTVASVDDDGDVDEIRPVEDTRSANSIEIKVNTSEIVEEDVVSVNNLKTIKDHIDLITRDKVKRSSGGGFWSAASVFSKKWLNWRHKQKIKKRNHGENLTTLPVEKPISRRYRETQSEIADYGFGRRSLDIDPRFSLDAPRISFDDQRYSFDEPRVSWDGYTIGRGLPRMAPPMVSVLEDAPPPERADMQIPLDEPTFVSANENSVPGGSAQTRDYYLDSSSRRRKSLERSSSIRKTAASVVAEIDDLKMAPSNAKVLPTNTTTTDYFRGGAKVLDSYPDSLRDDILENFEDKKDMKKSKKWSWKIWGFMHRRNSNNNNNKNEDDEEKDSKYSSVNGVERSLSQSWQESSREGNGDSRGVLRSNSSASWRNVNPIGGPFGNSRRSNVEIYGNNNGRRKSDVGLDKNRNVRHSPNNLDNGLLRFYLTPRGNHRRGATGRIKSTNPISVGRNVMRL